MKVERLLIAFIIFVVACSFTPNIILEYNNPSNPEWVTTGIKERTDTLQYQIKNDSYGFFLPYAHEIHLVIDSDAPVNVYCPELGIEQIGIIHFWYNDYEGWTAGTFWSISNSLIEELVNVTITITTYLNEGHHVYVFDWEPVIRTSFYQLCYISLGAGLIFIALFLNSPREEVS